MTHQFLYACTVCKLGVSQLFKLRCIVSCFSSCFFLFVCLFVCFFWFVFFFTLNYGNSAVALLLPITNGLNLGVTYFNGI